MSALVSQFIKLKKLEDLTKEFAGVIGRISDLKNDIERDKNDFFKSKAHLRELQQLEGDRDRLKRAIHNLK